MANRVARGPPTARCKTATTHVETDIEASRDAGSIPAASIRLAWLYGQASRMARASEASRGALSCAIRTAHARSWQAMVRQGQDCTCPGVNQGGSAWASSSSISSAAPTEPTTLVQLLIWSPASKCTTPGVVQDSRHAAGLLKSSALNPSIRWIPPGSARFSSRSGLAPRRKPLLQGASMRCIISAAEESDDYMFRSCGGAEGPFHEAGLFHVRATAANYALASHSLGRAPNDAGTTGILFALSRERRHPCDC